MDDVTRLALAAREGDRVALSAFVAATQADVWRLCRLLAGPAHADDLTQETYERALRALPSFRAESGVRTWLWAIARRTVASSRRTRGRRARLAAALPRPRPAPDLAGGVSLDLLVDQLDSDRREAFVLTQVLGLSYAEAAEVCGCPVGTIRSRVARAREALLESLAEATR